MEYWCVIDSTNNRVIAIYPKDQKPKIWDIINPMMEKNTTFAPSYLLTIETVARELLNQNTNPAKYDYPQVDKFEHI